MEEKHVLELDNVKIWYPITKGIFKKTVGHVRAVDGVSFSLDKGETLGIVGESGCGKTTVGRAMVNLESVTSGSIRMQINDEMRDISSLNKAELLLFRKNVQMIFQDPYSALNPMKKIYTAMEEPLVIQGIRSKSERERIMMRALDVVNLPIEYLFKYPHEFSGGQRQRVCIARALEVDPSILICDEAVSALDVSIQAQVLNLLKKIQQEKKLTYVFIAHDLSVVQYMSDKIAVMYLGNIVELADAIALTREPLHPYTRSLLSAIPIPRVGEKKKRIILQGDVPSPINKPGGCALHERCTNCMPICREKMPELRCRPDGHCVACHMYQ